MLNVFFFATCQARNDVLRGAFGGVLADSDRKRSCISAPPSKKSDDFNKVGLGYLFFMRPLKERLTDDETSIILGALKQGSILRAFEGANDDYDATGRISHAPYVG